jgi:uncharacterized protein YndB with AHSA1/START domain
MTTTPKSKPAPVHLTTPSDREVVVTRVFDAPRALVFDALTTPELLRRWYGPNGWSLEVCDIDLKVGGAWRFVVRRPDGKSFGQRGVYREIVRGERIVNTESWEDWDPGETLVTTVLTENAGKTTFRSTMLFPSQEVRDVVLKGGLQSGATESYERLAEVLASISSSRARTAGHSRSRML